MTVDATYTPDTYAGTGSQTIFAYTFRILADADVKVQLKDSNGVFTTQTLTTHYTVSGAGDQAGGNITFVTAPAATDTVVITRNLSILQGTDYTENSTFPAESHEEALDELTMICQQINDETSRSLRVDASTSGFDAEFSPTANEYVRVASDGLSLETVALTAGGGIENVVDDPSPQLGASLDANGKYIDFDDATGIRDSNGNEQLIFQETASAVNHIEITNAAASSEPTIGAAGDDTNVAINFQGKGTGEYRFLGTSTAAAEIRLYEDTSNGTNYVGFKAPDATTPSSVTYTLPDGDGTNGQHLTTDGSGTLTWAASTSPSAGWTLIATATASASSTVDFDNNLDSTYDAYKLVISGMSVATDSVDIWLRVGTGATPTYQSGSDYGWSTHQYDGSAAAATADTNISMAGGIVASNAAGEDLGYEITIHDPSSTDVHTCVHFQGVLHRNTNSQVNFISGAGKYNATTAVTSLRVLASSGNITRGEFKLYGLAKS